MAKIILQSEHSHLELHDIDPQNIYATFIQTFKYLLKYSHILPNQSCNHESAVHQFK